VTRYQKTKEPASISDKEKSSDDFTLFGELSIKLLEGDMSELDIYLSQPVKKVANPHGGSFIPPPFQSSHRWRSII
jgi:hypothetical protein